MWPDVNVTFVVLALLAGACAKDPEDLPVDITPVGPPLNGLHVVGNQIQTAAGAQVALHGINRSGTEYKCIQSGGIFDGPYDASSIQAMASWRINAVRVPLNEGCWLGINGAPLDPSDYKAAIQKFVSLLEAYHIVPILDLHWAAPGTVKPDREQPLPNIDHSPTFWADVATTFAGDDGPVFELYNEPFPAGNRDNDTAWQCWRDGCTANTVVPAGGTSIAYQSAGMQMLVDAVRGAGSPNLLLLGGIQYSNVLSQWQAYAPTDPMNNLVAAWHIYNFNPCAAETCWDDVPATLAMTYPIIVTEFGENDCSNTFVEPLMSWLDTHVSGYLSWSWNAYGPCQPAVMNRGGQPWSLVTNYSSGAPNGGYAQAVHDHIIQVARTP
jgi:hypothetical protein